MVLVKLHAKEVVGELAPHELEEVVEVGVQT